MARRDPARLLDGWSAPEPSKTAAGAAVLIVLREAGSDVETLLIERTERPEDAASGQVALPGGRVEPEDPSLKSTALRESAEEVGLSSRDLALGPCFVEVRAAPVFSLNVAVFAAVLEGGAAPPLVGDPREVAHLFWLPRARLDSLVTVPRRTGMGELPVEAVVFNDHVVWGFTLRTLRSFFRMAPP